jgi:hypothetical protein
LQRSYGSIDFTPLFLQFPQNGRNIQWLPQEVSEPSLVASRVHAGMDFSVLFHFQNKAVTPS